MATMPANDLHAVLLTFAPKPNEAHRRTWKSVYGHLRILLSLHLEAACTQTNAAPVKLPPEVGLELGLYVVLSEEALRLDVESKHPEEMCMGIN